MDPNANLSFTVLRKTSKMLNVVCLPFSEGKLAQVHPYFDACLPVNVPIENDTPIAKNAGNGMNLFWTNPITKNLDRVTGRSLLTCS